MKTVVPVNTLRRRLAGAAALGAMPWPSARAVEHPGSNTRSAGSKANTGNTGSTGSTDWWAGWRAGQWAGFTTANVPQLDNTTLDALHATGARIARVGLHMRHDPVLGKTWVEAGDWVALQARLDHAHTLGLGLVVLGLLDDGTLPQPLWQDRVRQQGLVQCWAELGARLGRHPALAGVDLLNEPHPVVQGGALPMAQAQAIWWALALRVVLAFRAAGGTAPVVLEAVAGAHPSGLAGVVPLPVAGVVYSVHFYTPHDITHQGVSAAWPRRIPYPAGAAWGLGGWDTELGAGAIDAQRLRAELRGASGFARRHKQPMYVGEFGCVRWAPDGSAQRWVHDCLQVFADERWNWSFHSFRTWTGWDAEIASEARDWPLRSRRAPMMQQLQRAMARRVPSLGARQ